jgi:hypothetical protein
MPYNSYSRSNVGTARLLTALPFALLALHLLYVLSLPIFPSQDGPVRMYYADVFASLWRDPGAYNGYFEIRHMLPPYAFETYFFLAANLVFSAQVSEKLYVCLCLLATFGSVRYLARACGRDVALASSICLPFLLHKHLFMGLYNFVLGVPVAIGLCGFWLHNHARLTGGRSVAFLALTLLLLSLHPVPFLVAMLFICAHTAYSVGMDFRRNTRIISLLRANAQRLLHLLALCGAAGYIALFVTSGAPAGQWFNLGAASLKIRRHIRPALLFSDLSYVTLLFLVALAGAVLLATALWQRRRSFTFTPGDFTLLACAACGVIYLIAPDGMNGGSLFDERFLLCCLLFFCASMSAVELPAKWRTVVLLALAGASCLNLWIVQRRMAPVVDDLRAVLEAPVVPIASAGVSAAGFIVATSQENISPPLFTYAPYIWMPAHYFRRSHTVLLNSPWLVLPYTILRNRGAQPYHDRNADEIAGILESSRQSAGSSAQERVDLVAAIDRAGAAASPAARQVAERFGLKRTAWSRGSFALFVK